MNCPHCSKDIEGAIPKERLDQKQTALDAKNAAEVEYQKTIAALQQQLGEVSGLRDQYTALQKTHTELSQRTERRDAMRGLGLSESLEDGLRTFYESAQAGKEGDERRAWGEWLSADDGARANPILAPHFSGAAAAPAETNGTPAAAPAANPLPVSTGARPPGTSTAKMSPQQIRAYFQSPGFRALTPDKQKETLAELQRQHMPPG